MEVAAEVVRAETEVGRKKREEKIKRIRDGYNVDLNRFVLFAFVELDNDEDNDDDSQSQDDESPGDDPEEDGGTESLAGGAITSIKLGLVAAKEPLAIQGILESSGCVREDVDFFQRKNIGFLTEPVFDRNGTDGGNVNVGEIGDDGFEVNGAEFRKFGGGEFIDLGVLFDRAGDGDVNEGADVGLNGATTGV